MANWLLMVDKDYSVSATGGTSIDKANIFYTDNDKDALKEGKRRVKRMRYYLVAEDEPRAICFNINYDKLRVFKLGYKFTYYLIHKLISLIFKKNKEEQSIERTELII